MTNTEAHLRENQAVVIILEMVLVMFHVSAAPVSVNSSTYGAASSLTEPYPAQR